jgi:golgin subfamily B member 1
LRLTIARRMGVLQMTRRELDGAQDSFQIVLEIDPDDAAAQEALESIAGIREDQQRMLEDLRAEVKDAPSDRARAAALLTLAETLLDQSSNCDEPEQLLEEALDADASNGGVAATLIEIYVQKQAWEMLNSVGARWLDASDTADHFEILKQIGLALMSDSGNREPAVVQLLAAQKMRPADVDVVHALDGCLTLLDRSEELLEVLRAARRCSTVREQEREWLVREAEVVWRSQDDIVAAEKLFRRIRAVDPRNLTALLFYEDYLGRKEDWKRLYAVLNQRFALVEFEQRIGVAVKMAELAEFQMANPDKAIDAYKRVLADEPTNERASDALIQLFEKTDK